MNLHVRLPRSGHQVCRNALQSRHVLTANRPVVRVNVVSCNHLMLSLREAGGRPISMEPFPNGFLKTQPMM